MVFSINGISQIDAVVLLLNLYKLPKILLPKIWLFTKNFLVKEINSGKVLYPFGTPPNSLWMIST